MLAFQAAYRHLQEQISQVQQAEKEDIFTADHIFGAHLGRPLILTVHLYFHDLFNLCIA